MNRALIIVLFALSLGSCAPKRVVVSSDKVDSVKVVKEREIIEVLRVDTVRIEVPIESKEVVRKDSSHLETTFAKSDAKILADGSLFHSLENKAQTIEKEVIVKDIEDKTTEKEVIIQKERIEVPVPYPLNRWQKFLMWVGGVCLGMLGVWIVIRVVKLFK